MAAAQQLPGTSGPRTGCCMFHVSELERGFRRSELLSESREGSNRNEFVVSTLSQRNFTSNIVA
eukprot:scaffold15871_cov57-Skeletonema_menzelii.AAC.1